MTKHHIGNICHMVMASAAGKRDAFFVNIVIFDRRALIIPVKSNYGITFCDPAFYKLRISCSAAAVAYAREYPRRNSFAVSICTEF